MENKYKRYGIQAETDDDSFVLNITLENALPFINFDAEYVKDTTLLTGSIHIPKVKLKDDNEYISSVKSPYSGRVLSFYYNKTKQVLFAIPSLDWCKNYANVPNKLSHNIYGYLLGVVGDFNVERPNILMQQGIFNNEIIKRFDSKPNISPVITVNNIMADGLNSTASSYRISVEKVTILNSIPVNIIKLGSANSFNTDKIPVFKNAYTGLKNYSSLKYVGEIKTTEDIYIALMF